MRDDDPWIQAYSGGVFPLRSFSGNAILIEDIAHALGMLCRFNGHCHQFYSVAEHSVHVSREIREDIALLGLMHDSAESYLGDVPSPLKDSLPAFHDAEWRLLNLIANKYGFEVPAENSTDATELARADLQLLADEKELLTHPEPKPWRGLPPPKNPARIQCWSPEEAKQQFLARFLELRDR